MPRPGPACALALLEAFACLARPLPAAVAGTCSAPQAPCAVPAAEMGAQGHVDTTVEIDEASAVEMGVTLLQAPFGLARLPLVAAGASDAGERRAPARARARQEAGPVNQTGEPAAFDCGAHPWLCEAPFDCGAHPPNGPADLALAQWTAGRAAEGLAKNGPNLQAWCQLPQYESYVYECLVQKDLAKAGWTQYNLTKAGAFGKDTYELDGSYCFIEGHCLNTKVTGSTTLEEANQMCDARYGRSRWSAYGSLSSRDVVGTSPPKNPSNGFDGQEATTPFLVAACAMGNYHCDVMYCKETYCKDPYMLDRYGHFLEDLGWTESAAPWMHAGTVPDQQ